jgi:aldehyde reductase
VDLRPISSERWADSEGKSIQNGEGIEFTFGGMECPRLVLGTYEITQAEDLGELLRYALEDCGYRHIDCARRYENQEEIGAALQFVFGRGKVKREDVWITSKLWNNAHEPERVEAACRDTLGQLKLDYLDLYLIHQPISVEYKGIAEFQPVDEHGNTLFLNTPIAATWKAMEALVEKGLARHIGVSNFTIAMLEKMRHNPDIRIQPFTNQVEFHLFMQQEPMRWYLKQRGILLSAYSPLGAPGFQKNRIRLLEDPTLVAVSKETGRSPAAVALRFLDQIEDNMALIVKSASKERLKMNTEYKSFSLSDEQIAKLKQCEKCYRYWRYQEEFGVDILGDGW